MNDSLGIAVFNAYKWGLINTSGDVIVEDKYEFFQAENFAEGLVFVESEKWSGYIDINGNQRFQAAYGYPFQEGAAVVGDHNVRVQYGIKYGFINHEGTLFVPFQYDKANSFADGMALVEVNGKKGFIDKTGKLAIKPIYDSGCDFNGGFSSVTRDNQFFLIDKTGKETQLKGYLTTGIVINGLAQVYKSDPTSFHPFLGFVDRTGREVLSCEYRSMSQFFGNISIVSRFGYGDILMNKSGAILSKPYYTINVPQEKVIVVKAQNAFSGLINRQGKELTSFKFEEISTFHEGIARARLHEGNLCGLLNDEGKEVTAFIYDRATDFNEGFACLERNHVLYFVDKSGRIKSKFSQADVYLNGAGMMSEGMAIVQNDSGTSHQGVVDINGKVIVPCNKYDQIELFSEGLAAVKLNNKWGFINKLGEEVVVPTYESVQPFKHGLSMVYSENSCTFINKSGKAISDKRFFKAEPFIWVSKTDE